MGILICANIFIFNNFSVICLSVYSHRFFRSFSTSFQIFLQKIVQSFMKFLPNSRLNFVFFTTKSSINFLRRIVWKIIKEEIFSENPKGLASLIYRKLFFKRIFTLIREFFFWRLLLQTFYWVFLHSMLWMGDFFLLS